MKTKLPLAVALALGAAFAAPAFAADAAKSDATGHKMMAHDHKMMAKGHKMHAKRIRTKDGTMQVCKDHGCLMTMSKDGNRMTMMSAKGEILVGDKAAKTLMMMGPDAKLAPVAMDAPEAKMFMDHMQSMSKK